MTILKEEDKSPLRSIMTDEDKSKLRHALNQMCCHFDITKRKPSREIDAAITQFLNGKLAPGELCDFMKKWTHSEPSSDFRLVGYSEVEAELEEWGFYDEERMTFGEWWYQNYGNPPNTQKVTVQEMIDAARAAWDKQQKTIDSLEQQFCVLRCWSIRLHDGKMLPHGKDLHKFPSFSFFETKLNAQVQLEELESLHGKGRVGIVVPIAMHIEWIHDD